MEHKLLIEKAGLVPESRKLTMLAKKILGESYTFENKIMVQYGSSSQVLADRADIPESTVPYVVNGTIKGYWANGLTPEEQKTLQSVYNLPVYTADSEIPLQHDKSYDLSIPAEKAEYLVIKATGTIAETQELILASQNFYFIDEHQVEKQRKDDLTSRVNLAKTIGTYSNSKKVVVLLAYQYKIGMLDDLIMEAKEQELADQYDELVFADPRGLNNVIADSTYELKAKMQLYLLSQTIVLGAGNDYFFDSGNGRERIGPNKESVERFITSPENAEKLNLSFDRKTEIRKMALLKNSLSNPVVASQATDEVSGKVSIEDYPGDLVKASREGWTLGELRTCGEARLDEYAEFLLPMHRPRFAEKSIDEKRDFAIKNFLKEA